MFKKILSPVEIWRHDLTSCLQDDVATVLLYAGQDPVVALGAAWEFYYPEGDYRREEYYFPCRDPQNPVASLAPFHPVTSKWHTPCDGEEGWEQVKESLSKGIPAIIAVDNYYLPFRPAYQDVHTNHLIVLYGIDEEAGVVHVLDNKPPQFNATIPIDVLHAARRSVNPGSDRSLYFYTNNPIESRWLEVKVTGEFPQVTKEWVRGVIAENLKGFRDRTESGVYRGQQGLADYLAAIVQRAKGPEGPDVMDELYVVGWAVQQQTALHGDFLIKVGRDLGWHRLAEIGRDVNALAHHWSDLRMLGAHNRHCAADVTERIARRAAMLLNEQERVLQQLEWVLDDSSENCECAEGGSGS